MLIPQAVSFLPSELAAILSRPLSEMGDVSDPSASVRDSDGEDPLHVKEPRDIVLNHGSTESLSYTTASSPLGLELKELVGSLVLRIEALERTTQNIESSLRQRELLIRKILLRLVHAFCLTYYFSFH